MSIAETPEATMTQKVAALWRELFADPELRLASTDNFFALGASSLLAMTMVERLRVDLGLPVSMVAVLENPELGALAAHLMTLLADREQGEL